MSSFKENLESLPSVDGIARLELYAGDSYEPVAVIENAPGQAGSLAVYYKLAVDFGGIGPAAAKKGLELYAEHVEDARAHPGKHPNIDRLLAIVESGDYLSAKALPKNEE